LRRCENNVKRIAIFDEKIGLSPEEQYMRLNAMKGMTAKVRGAAVRFRTVQKDFLLKMKKREDFPQGVFEEFQDDDTLKIDEIMEQGFTPQQMEEIQRLRREGAEREKQIAQIATSINELAQMFKELSVLIVEQGSIIDRIDYNIDQTKTHVQKGLQELHQAKSSQDKSTNCAWICMVLLFLAILVCIAIIAAKFK
jgi:syntaxin 16